MIDELIEFKPDFSISSGENELNKRNIGLEYAKTNSVNYFMTMDTDEFYIKSEFLRAKEYIVENSITHSFCDIVNYGISPNDRFISQTPSYVQFFSKIKKCSRLTMKNKKIIAIVDPTRILSHYYGAKYFFLSNIQMHHMTYVRKDLELKLLNSNAEATRKVKAQDLDKKVENICIKVDNIFNITI